MVLGSSARQIAEEDLGLRDTVSTGCVCGGELLLPVLVNMRGVCMKQKSCGSDDGVLLGVST